MPTHETDTRKTLNDLIRTAQDGHHGYQAAGQALSDDELELKKVFGHHALERKQFVEELQSQVARLGGEPEHKGTAKGAVHRGWIEIKAGAAGDHTARKVLDEVVRGETAAVDAYEEALDGDLPPEPREVVRRQLTRVQEVREEMRSRRDRLEK